MPGGSESHLLTITIVDLENPDNDGILIEQVIPYRETQSFVTSQKPQLLFSFGSHHILSLRGVQVGKALAKLSSPLGLT